MSKCLRVHSANQDDDDGRLGQRPGLHMGTVSCGGWSMAAASPIQGCMRCDANQLIIMQGFAKWQGGTAPGAPRGDLIVELRVMEHARFQRHGDDLRCTVAVPLHQASLQATAALAKFGTSKCCLCKTMCSEGMCVAAQLHLRRLQAVAVFLHTLVKTSAENVSIWHMPSYHVLKGT